ncbi:hypothetical protein BC831DRAFT_473333 [Entophlyctis helioformis]|nr:hypothetical protein BC831DRAFT_481950 [Entophlyctis helioformis]KAI8923048.1 hypothetical protein BC831DRAFT_473333 [Entophlyctis helioformis]
MQPGELRQDETFWQRTKRKASENPFVLPAVGLTLFAFYRMTEALQRRDVVDFQKAQRFRISAQMLAIGTLVGGFVWSEYKRQIAAAAPATPSAAAPSEKPSS